MPIAAKPPPHRWIEPEALRVLVLGSDVADGRQPLADLLVGTELLAVSEPSLVPLDRDTYRVRFKRWREEGSPVWHGAEQFMQMVEDAPEPISVVTVSGDATNYIVMLDAEASRVVATLGIDRPDDYAQSVP